MIEAVNGVGRREIEMRWESVKGLGDEEGFNRMVEYLSRDFLGMDIGGSLKQKQKKRGSKKLGKG